jgi:hypothetical protein
MYTDEVISDLKADGAIPLWEVVPELAGPIIEVMTDLGRI